MPRKRNFIPIYTTAKARAAWRDQTIVRINGFEAKPLPELKPYRCSTCGEKVTTEPSVAAPCSECKGY